MSKRVIACFLFVIFFSSIIITDLNAFAYNSFYSQNDILFYDQDANNCSNTSTGASTDGSTSDVVTSGNLETILRFFTGKGLSLAAAAGIAGNFSRESGYNPAKIQSSSILATSAYEPEYGVGFGIAQWTYTDRQQPLVDMAKTQGKSIIDLGLQLDYTWNELTTDYKPVLESLNAIKSNTTIGSTSAPMAAAIIFHGRTDKIANDPTQEITDVVNSSIGFHTGFEGSDDTTETLITTRGKMAENIYNTYKGKISDGTGVTDITIETTSSYSTTVDCSNASGDATWPDNVEAHGSGWIIKDNVDYSGIPCAEGTTDAGTYLHPTQGYTIRLCETGLGKVSSLISAKVLALIAAAKQSGIVLTGGGYRTYEEQIEMRKTNGCADIMTTPPSKCTVQTAIPGTSMHERGLAVDFDNCMEGSTVWNWLVANGSKYGFYNLPAENWHWSMSGN